MISGGSEPLKKKAIGAAIWQSGHQIVSNCFAHTPTNKKFGLRSSNAMIAISCYFPNLLSRNLTFFIHGELNRTLNFITDTIFLNSFLGNCRYTYL